MTALSARCPQHLSAGSDEAMRTLHQPERLCQNGGNVGIMHVQVHSWSPQLDRSAPVLAAPPARLAVGCRPDAEPASFW